MRPLILNVFNRTDGAVTFNLNQLETKGILISPETNKIDFKDVYRSLNSAESLLFDKIKVVGVGETAGIDQFFDYYIIDNLTHYSIAKNLEFHQDSKNELVIDSEIFKFGSRYTTKIMLTIFASASVEIWLYPKIKQSIN